MIPKFRAWDRIKKRMFLVLEIDYENKLFSDETYWNTIPFNDVELMQFTGLKDKNSKEIYEGDIVRYKLGRNIFTEVVAYDKDSAGFGVVDNGVDGIIFSFGELWEDIDLHNLEVIGNKYNNPELLKGEGE